MDSNIEIIRTILGGSHTAPRIREASNYYAPNFTYSSPFRNKLNFEEYCQNLALVRANTEFDIKGIKDVGACYEVELGITILHGKARKKTYLSAKAECFFENGLIQHINVKYKATAVQAAYILAYTVAFSMVG